MLSTDGKWKITPRLHSVKFVFDALTPVDAHAPDNIVFDNPFVGDNPGVPKQFIFKKPKEPHNTQDSNIRSNQARHDASGAEPKAGSDLSSHDHSRAGAADEPVDSHVSRLRGPTCDLSGLRGPFEPCICAAWTLILSSRADSQQVEFEICSTGHKLESAGRPLQMQLAVSKSNSISAFHQYVEDSWKNATLSEYHADVDDGDGTAANPTSPFSTLIDFTASMGKPRHGIGKSSYAIHLACVVEGPDVSLSATLNDRAISRLAVRLLLHDLEHVLWQMSIPSTGSQTLENIKILSPASQRHLVQLNRPLPEKEDTFIHDLVAEQAGMQPDAQAICAWDGSLSYSELQQHADRLGCYLSSIGVGPEVLVPVIFEKSVFSIVAILAIVRAGGVVVALDPSLPDARIDMIVQNVQASVVISSAQTRCKIPSHIPSKTRVIVDNYLLTKLPSIATSPESPCQQSKNTDNALYVVFTSGSTGKPKGVVVTHSAFSSSAKGFSKAIRLDSPTRRVLQYSSFSFDISMLEIFTALVSGACLCVPSEEDRMNNLATCISELNVNWAMLTPSVASLVSPDEVPSLEVLCLAGEALPQAVADTWADHVTTINAYGPAECSAITIVSEPRVRGVKSMSIGRPPNCAVWIVGENGTLAPFNTVGEIVIEGAPVARGYLGDKAKTNEVFLDNPEFLRGVVRDPDRCYRTGDLGRMNPDGSIDFIGRKDTQVKINGQRVELGEIEHQLRQALDFLSQPMHATPTQSTWDVAVELLRPKEGDFTILSVFLATESKKGTSASRNDILLEETEPSWTQMMFLTSDIRSKLAESLPAYMVPKAFVPCRKLPLSPSGKIDRKTLRTLGNSMTVQQLMASTKDGGFSTSADETDSPSPGLIESEEESSVGQHTLLSDTTPLSGASVAVSENMVAVLTPMERSLRMAWATVLKLPDESITPDDDFFRLGGDSIGAIKAVAACRQLGLQINVANIFKNPVLRYMALVCKSSASEQPSPVTARYMPFQFLHEKNLLELKEEASFQCGIEADDIKDLYPCTHMQEGLMAVNLTRPGSYTGRWIHPLPKDVNLPRFRRAWERIHRGSPILQTRFATTTSAGSLQAVIREDVHWLAHDDLDAYLEEDDANPMFPGDALNRFAIISSRDGEKTFVWTIHHMLYDGWSLAMLCKRLNDTYYDRPVKLATDYRNFITYTQQLNRDDSAQYWKDELRGVPQSVFPVPAKPGHQSFARAVVRDALEIDLDQSSGITMSTMVRAAWSLMIGHFSTSDDVLFGATVSGRNAPLADIENIEGPTIATVPVRVRIDRKSTVLESLRRVQDHATAMIPFEQTGIQRIKTLNEDTKRGCEFQNLLIVQAGGGWDEIGPGPLGKPRYREEFTTFPVTCEVWLYPGRVDFATHVDEDVTSRAFVARAIEVVKIIMTQLSWATYSSQTDFKLESLSFDKLHLSKPLKQTPSQEGNVEKVSIPIHDLVSRQCLAQPGRDAVISTSDTLSYDELETMSSSLAFHMTDIGICPGNIVPICFEKSVWTVVSMLAVLKTGAAFVLLDASQPISRLRKIVNEVNATLLITSLFHAKATDLAIPRQLIVDKDFLQQLSSSRDPSPAPLNFDSDVPAYVIFTSGSTGTPKGIVILHSAFASSAMAHGRTFGMCNSHRVLQFSSYSFDAGLFEILTTLIHGGTVCVPDENERIEGLKEFVREANVNFALLTPSVARLVRPSDVPSLETLVLGGEAPDQALITTWLDSGVRLFNAYGPSESSVIAAIQTCSPTADPRTIGNPVGCRCWIVDKDDPGILVPEGEIGELLIEGPTLADGYLNDPVKTAQAFISCPAWRSAALLQESVRLYKTGDLAKRLGDGTMIYNGRKDLQVKINGQRIELGDVETHLATCQSVKGGVVIFPASGPFARQLVAVVELGDGGSEPRKHHQGMFQSSKEVEKTREELASKVPSIMLPLHWIDSARLSSERLPFSASGKVDRNKITSWVEDLSPDDPVLFENLTPVTIAKDIITPDEKPAYELAERISTLVPSKTLSSNHDVAGGFEDVLLQSSGLDSLSMMSLMHFIHLKYHVRASMQFLMDGKTSIRSLASVISNSGTHGPSNIKHDSSTLTQAVDIMAEIKKHNAGLHKLQKKTESIDMGSIHFKSRDLTVFLTGASGYLGTQLLRQLLERRDVDRVVVVARGETAEDAKEHVLEAARKALWWTEFHEEKLEVWKGDLSMPRLGLHEGQWDLLGDGHSFDIVIHNGAVVHWNKSYSALEAVNVGSTVELLGLAVESPVLRFLYVSGGRQWQSADENDEDVARDLSSSMGYSQTKFVSEVLVKRATERCQPGRRNISVFRPGLIIGTPTEGVANLDDYIWRMTAANIDIGAYNAEDDDAWLHVSDATTTAAAVVLAAFSPDTITTSVANHEEGMTWGTFWRLIQGMGFKMTPVPASEWLAATKRDIALRKEEHPLWPLAHLLEVGSMEWNVRVQEHKTSALQLKVAVKRNVEYLMKAGFLQSSAVKGGALLKRANTFSRSSK